MTKIFFKQACLLFVFLWMTKTSANSLAIPVFDDDYNELGNIQVGIDEFSSVEIPLPNTNYQIEGQKGRITAIFFAKEDLGKAIDTLSANHFNWVNIVIQGDNAIFPQHPRHLHKTMEAPWIDPLPRGNKGRKVSDLDDDTMPYFWSEENCNIRMISQEIKEFTTLKQSIFTDYPNNVANSTVYFETYLVFTKDEIGDSANKTFYILGGFSWASKIEKSGERGNIMDLKPISITSSKDDKVLDKINEILFLSCFKNWKALFPTQNIPLATSLLE